MHSPHLESLAHLDDGPLRNTLRLTSAPAHWLAGLGKVIAGLDDVMAATRTTEPFRCAPPLADVDPLAALQEIQDGSINSSDSVDSSSDTEGTGFADRVDSVAQKPGGSQGRIAAQPRRKKPGNRSQPRGVASRQDAGQSVSINARSAKEVCVKPDFGKENFAAKDQAQAHQPLPRAEYKTVPGAQLKQMCNERSTQKQPDKFSGGARQRDRSDPSAPIPFITPIKRPRPAQPLTVLTPQTEVGARLLERLMCARAVEPASTATHSDEANAQDDVRDITRAAIRLAFATPVQKQGSPAPTQGARVGLRAVEASLAMRDRQQVQQPAAPPSTATSTTSPDGNLLGDEVDAHLTPGSPGWPTYARRPKPAATLSSALRPRVTPAFELNDADEAGTNRNHTMPQPATAHPLNVLTMAMTERQSVNDPEPASAQTESAVLPDMPTHAPPAIQNTFNVTVHMNGDAGSADSNDELAERLARVLADQARRYGIDV